MAKLGRPRGTWKPRHTPSAEANALIIEVNAAKRTVDGEHFPFAFHRLTPIRVVNLVAGHFFSHGYEVSVGAGPTLTLSRPSPFDQKAG